MANDLAVLINSIKDVKLATVLNEIIFVNDGSTDSTQDEIEKLCRDFSNIRLINLYPRMGRYDARLIGAKAALGKTLLYLDTRTIVPKDFCNHLEFLISNYRVVQGVVEIQYEESIYSLYWDRSHRFLFKKNFEESLVGFYLTNENFENYVCGTTIFMCEKEIFLKACSCFQVSPQNDDRHLIREICNISKIFVTDKLLVYWKPRQSLGEFLYRLWEKRGGFVEYHFIGTKTPLTVGVWVGILSLLINVAILIFLPQDFGALALLELILIALSVLVFAKSAKEFFLLAPLHVLVVLSFGAGVVVALVGHYFKKLSLVK